jgi:hypothetical protein
MASAINRREVVAGGVVEAVAGFVTSPPEGDVRWSLDAFNGVKHPNDAAPATPIPLQSSFPIRIKDWAMALFEEIDADFQVGWQNNGTWVGNISIANIFVTDALGLASNVRATIAHDNRIYNKRIGRPQLETVKTLPLLTGSAHAAGCGANRKQCAAMRIRFDQVVGSAHKAAVDLHQLGDGTYSRYGRRIQRDFL